MNNYIVRKIVNSCGYSLENFVNLPVNCQRIVISNYFANLYSEENKSLNEQLDAIIAREYEKKRLIKKIIR